MRQGINSKELRHLNYYYDERLRKSSGYGKRGLSCRAVIYKFLARGLWGEPHPSFVPCVDQGQEDLRGSWEAWLGFHDTLVRGHLGFY